MPRYSDCLSLTKRTTAGFILSLFHTHLSLMDERYIRARASFGFLLFLRFGISGAWDRVKVGVLAYSSGPAQYYSIIALSFLDHLGTQ